MKMLLCLPDVASFHLLRQSFIDKGGAAWPIEPQDFLQSIPLRYAQHEIDVLFCGNALFEMSHKMTKAISTRYNLALYAGFSDAINPSIAVGTVVNVIKEKPLLFDVEGADLYESKSMDTASFPHFKGGFVNMNNSYLNIFVDFKKVVSGTIAKKVDATLAADLFQKYKTDVLTMNGIGFVYNCMFERQPFYQISVVKKNIATDTADKDLAIEQLNLNLIEILKYI